jgi:hypothetical protein
LVQAGRGDLVSEFDIKYRELADMNRRIYFLETKAEISAGEQKELKILEFARNCELQDRSREVMAREG